MAVGMLGDVDGDGRIDVQLGHWANESFFYAGTAGMFGLPSTPTLTLFAPMGYTGVQWGSCVATQ